MAEERFLAFDLGAESGRAVAGSLDNGRLTLEALHRFPNGPVRVLDHIHWNLLGLFREMNEGLRLFRERFGDRLDGLGVDTWGVDYGLLGPGGVLLGHPFHYRDTRTDDAFEEAFRLVSRREIYKATGTQLMPINTLFQLHAARRAGDPLLAKAERLLFMPDLFHYLFTGEAASEYTIASTSQMYDMQADEWAAALLRKLGLPTGILPDVMAPGSIAGELLPALADAAGLRPTVVIAGACHDTAAAVAAVPTEGGDSWCYLSSGTWSLMGVETPEPVITERSRELNFTNEGGVDGTIRLLKNIMGLWMVQELRREWQRAGTRYEYGELVALAEAAEPFRSLVHIEHPPFLQPGGMAEKIAAFCAAAGEPAPATPGQFVRAALESLALHYRLTLAQLEELTGRNLRTIHIVGGGSQNRLLDQFAADSTGRTVLAGPVEATAAGNLLMQAVAVGRVGSIAELRQIVRASFEVERYEPRDPAAWEAPYQRYLALSES